MRNCLLLLFICNFCYAQQNITDSVYVIKQIEIQSNKNQFYKKANKNQNLDSTVATMQNFSLADVLSKKSPVFIKNYGQGALATMSFRGTSANHTAIVWNGFNIQSAMNGTLDLSLIPAFLLDNVELDYGGESALYGSGAIGGTIQIYSQAKFQNDLTVQLHSAYSSILENINGVKVNYSNKKQQTIIKIFNQNSKNEYQFYNYIKPETPIETQKNAAQKANAIVFENYFNFKKNQILSIKAWYQKNNRNIPSSIFYNLGSAQQQDENLRICAEWNKYWNKTKLSIRAANLNENIEYQDSLSFLKALSNSNSSIIELDVKKEIFENNYLEVGVNTSYIVGKSNSYSTTSPIINKQALLLSYKVFFSQKLSGIFSVRQEVFNEKLVPFTFSSSLNYTLIKQIKIFTKVSKNYRLPTFNDLYWVPGGNINLLPETGFCEELGLTYALSTKLKIENTIYNKNIKNWIIWLPKNNYWTPQNILQVWSRGYEAAITTTIPISKLIFFADVRYNYTLSTNQKVNFINDASLYKQLIYVPIYNTQSTIGLMYKKIKIDANHVYSYYRYTTSDNKNFLNPYQITNLAASYLTKEHKNYSLFIAAQINNLFNTQYEILAGKPMPLRFYQLSLTLKFKKHNYEN